MYKNDDKLGFRVRIKASVRVRVSCRVLWGRQASSGHQADTSISNSRLKDGRRAGYEDNLYQPIPGRPKPQLQLTSISMYRHTQPVPLCAQPADGPARLYVSQPLLSDECPPTCSIGSLAGSVPPNMAITSVASTFSVTSCRE